MNETQIGSPFFIHQAHHRPKSRSQLWRCARLAALATVALIAGTGCDRSKKEEAAASASPAAQTSGTGPATKRASVYDAARAEELRKKLDEDPTDSAALAEWAAMGKPVAKDLMYHVLSTTHAAGDYKGDAVREAQRVNHAIAATTALAGLGAIEELKRIAKDAEREDVRAAACAHLVKAGESCK